MMILSQDKWNIEKSHGKLNRSIHYVHIHELEPRESIESRLSSRTHIDESQTPIPYGTHRHEFVTRGATQSNSLYTRSWARASCSMRRSAFHVRHEFVTHQYKFVTKKGPSDSLYSRARASCSRRRSAVLCCLRYPEAPVHLNYIIHQQMTGHIHKTQQKSTNYTEEIANLCSAGLFAASRGSSAPRVQDTSTRFHMHSHFLLRQKRSYTSCGSRFLAPILTAHANRSRRSEPKVVARNMSWKSLISFAQSRSHFENRSRKSEPKVVAKNLSRKSLIAIVPYLDCALRIRGENQCRKSEPKIGDRNRKKF